MMNYSRLLKGLILSVVTLLFGPSVSLVMGAEPLLKSGDRVIFLGDSITQAGADAGGYVTMVREGIAKSHPDTKIEVIGAGISGNRVPDLEKRLDRDVLDKKPTLVVIYIGINDVWHSQNGKGTSKEDFEQGLKRIIGKIQGAGARVVLCTPSVIGEKTVGENSLDKMLDEYSSISRRVAHATHSNLLDLRRRFVRELKKSNEKNQPNGILTSDGVHLNAAGNAFVAHQMAAALHGDNDATKVLRHVVMFQFKASATPSDVEEVVKEFDKLPKGIPEIHAYERGTNVSPENLAQGLTHCFFVTFTSDRDRDVYLTHPVHEAFVKIAVPRIEKAVVVDYWND